VHRDAAGPQATLPSMSAYRASGQLLHVMDPVELANVPSGHWVQTVLPTVFA
jgi:hypothetical protein